MPDAPEPSGRRPLLIRVRERLLTERAISTFVAAALFGVLAGELGLTTIAGWVVSGWDFDIVDVVIFAALCGIVGGLDTRNRVLRILWIGDAALVALMCVVNTPVMPRLTERWVRADSIPAGGLDAIVVPGSSLTSSGTLSVVGSDRLLSGLELVRRGVAPLIVTTRVVCCGSHGQFTSDADQRRLITLAGAESKWLLVGGELYSTHDEALAVDRKLRELGARKIAVVTSPLHTRRACAAYERDGMRVTCVPSLERGDQTRAPGGEHNRLTAFRTYLYERLGWWQYRRRGWV